MIQDFLAFKLGRSVLAAIMSVAMLGIVMSDNADAAGGSLKVKLKTNKGDIEVSLTPAETPVTVASFANLVKRGFYSGVKFHRVIPGFVIQGGDPTGTGRGGPGYRFEDECKPSLKHDGVGVLSMANAGPGTNGSQFFITLGAQPHLDGKHTVFGKVTSGMELLNQVKQGDEIESAELIGDPSELFEAQAEKLAEWNKILDARQ